MPNRNSVDWQQFLEWEVKLVKAYPESWQLNRGNKDVRLWAGWKSKSDSDQNALSGLWICHIPSLMAAAKRCSGRWPISLWECLPLKAWKKIFDTNTVKYILTLSYSEFVVLYQNIFFISLLYLPNIMMLLYNINKYATCIKKTN